MARRGVCGRCGTVRRKGRAATSAPSTSCLACFVPLCTKHAIWVPDRNGYVCRKCLPEESTP